MQNNTNEPYAPNRSITPNRIVGAYNRPEDTTTTTVSPTQTSSSGPSSTGLIRLSLKKPMGIVFEPMYDPNQPSAQRGVRICDLPRTGAAALSRKLQVGDELLQINDKTVSRLTFDEIMDFIIDADPDSVNLLFRRPRKETLQARQGVQQKLNAAANKDAPSTVKWVDEASGSAPPEKKKPPKESSSSSRKERKKEKKSKRSKRGSVSEEEETFQSSVGGDDSYAQSKRRKPKGRGKRDPYETESFLDLLIDTICSNPNNVFRRNDDYFSDEESSGSESKDEDTYVTYEESVDAKKEKKKSNKKVYDDDDDEESEVQRRDKRKEQAKPERKSHKYEEKKFDIEEEETVESIDRARDKRMSHERQPEREAPREVIQPPPVVEPPVHVPLGLAPSPPSQQQPPAPMQQQQFTEEEVSKQAPIRELEYDDRIDHGADVSVMESLGGPSLLIEKQRAASSTPYKPPNAPVSQEIMDEYGLDYPTEFGKTREDTIQADPLRFYTYVVKNLLEEHEPEKVRLLDKLLAKYKGREDHLVQKLSVRYNRPAEESAAAEPDQKDEFAFSDAVQKSKSSPVAAATVNSARERMQEPPEDNDGGFVATWPDKEQKEPEMGDSGKDVDGHVENEDDRSESGSEYSRDSVDGTSPAVIAQVSELLNYVYGKTSVPGQIDRVSTIMRAYEGREAVLLELLETKALIKANKEKENADELPAFLRNSPQMQQFDHAEEAKEEIRTPMSSTQVGNHALNDDISSMSGVSSPTTDRHDREPMGAFNMPTHMEANDDDPFFSPKTSRQESSENFPASGKSNKPLPPTTTPDKKKKKGIFGGLFSKKKGKEPRGRRTKGGVESSI